MTARKITAAITAPVYLIAEAFTPSTLKAQSRSKDAASLSICSTASPAALSGTTLMPLTFLNADASRPSKIFLPSRIADFTRSDLPCAPAICTLTPWYLPGFTSEERLMEEEPWVDCGGRGLRHAE